MGQALVRVNNPNRVVYTAYKKLQIAYLQRIYDLYPNKLKLVIFEIGATVPLECQSLLPKRIAKCVFIAFQKNKHFARYYSFSGRLLKWVYAIHPVLAKCLILLRRNFFKTHVKP